MSHSPSRASVSISTHRIGRTKKDINSSASRSRVYGASALSASSRSKVAGATPNAGSSQAARVFLDGVDVTPQSLLFSRIKPSSSHGHTGGGTGKTKVSKGSRSKAIGASNANILSSASVGGESASVSSLDSDNISESSTDINAVSSASASSSPSPSSKQPPTTTSQALGKVKPLSSSLKASAQSKEASETQDEDPAAGIDGDTTDGLPKQPMSARSGTGSLKDDAQKENAPANLPRRPITIEFLETPTVMLFELRSICVGQDSVEHQTVCQRNKQYLEICAQKKGSDRYVSGKTQTLQLSQKTKEVMTAPPATRDAACSATDWDIYDCTRTEEEAGNDHEDTALDTFSKIKENVTASSSENDIIDVNLKRQVDEIVRATVFSPGCVLDVDGDIVEDLKARQYVSRPRRTKHHHHAPSGSHSTLSNGQRSRPMQSSLDVGRSSMNVMSSVSLASTGGQASESSMSFGASQQDVSSSAPPEGSSSALVAQNSQVGASVSRMNNSNGASSTGSDDGKQSAYSRANTNVDIGEIIFQQKTTKVLSSHALLRTVGIVERAVQQNVYHPKHLLYRNFPSLALNDQGSSALSGLMSGRKRPQLDGSDWRTIGASGGTPVVPPLGKGGITAGHTAQSRGHLEKLWGYHCELTEGKRVTCLAWNTVNDDLLAVSYTKQQLKKTKQHLSPAVNPNAATPQIPTAISDEQIDGERTEVVASINLPSGNPPMPTAAPGTATSTSESSEQVSKGDQGLVLFWSLKNPEYPERVFTFEAGVTCVDFSQTHPYLLAVGFADGVVSIYDTRKNYDANNSQDTRLATSSTATTHAGNATASGSATAKACTTSTINKCHMPTPVATSEASSGKHLDAVWRVKWINKGSERGENVVSISSDGRVTEWSMKKGLSFSDLMTLKRLANPLLGSDSRADGVISRTASGNCIDFAVNDPSVYFVGTGGFVRVALAGTRGIAGFTQSGVVVAYINVEDGLIHKCSVSYNEQYLETYYGHTGPVYELLVSPFWSEVFLSCSGDWNVKLWHHTEQKELLTFHAVDLAHAVQGISWCPHASTIFGSVTEDGRIEVYDLQQSTLDPIITYFPKKFGKMSDLFAPNLNINEHVPDNALTTATSTVAGGNPTSTTAGGATGAGTGSVVNGLDASGAGSAPSRPTSTSADSNNTAIDTECTTIAFAPKAPVIVVGDSTGEVSVYRVSTLAEARCECMSFEEQVARLQKAIYPQD